MTRIAFLNDTSSWYHWGCTGTSEAIKAALAARGHEVTPVPIQAIYGCRNPPTRTQDFDDPQFFNRFFHENLPVTGPILQSDVIVINGEGSLHGLSQIAIVLLYLAYSAKRCCKKNVQIINHSCYPTDLDSLATSPIAEIYRGVYRHLDFVAVREHLSRELLQRLGISATLSFDCLPLYISKHPPESPAQRSPAIVLAGSVAWRPEGLSALGNYIDTMTASGHSIQVLTGARSDPARDDVAFLDALRQHQPTGWKHVDAASLDEWLTTIASASLLISGRFHYTIASCMLDTPCIVLNSNTPKNCALCEEAGLAPPINYDDAQLEHLLHERTKAILGHPPLSPDVKKEWLDRAGHNFDAL